MESSISIPKKSDDFNAFIQTSDEVETCPDTNQSLNNFSEYEETSLQLLDEEIELPKMPFQAKSLMDELPNRISEVKEEVNLLEEERAKRIQAEKRNSELEAENADLKRQVQLLQDQLLNTAPKPLEKEELKKKNKKATSVKELWKMVTDSLFLYAILWWIWDACSSPKNSMVCEYFSEQLFAHFERKISKSLVNLSSEIVSRIKMSERMPRLITQGANKLIAEGIVYLAQLFAGKGKGSFKKIIENELQGVD